MKLTVIPSDKAVYVDKEVKHPLEWDGTPLNVHALQWHDVTGWIEFNDGTPNEEINSLPDWANNAYNAWSAPAPPPPEPEPPTASENKTIAMSLLAQTDWTALPDVSDPAKSNPYLANANEFNTYRNIIRQYAINPVDGEIEWATKPIENWQSV
jgi:hypothetical protein